MQNRRRIHRWLHIRKRKYSWLNQMTWTIGKCESWHLLNLLQTYVKVAENAALTEEHDLNLQESTDNIWGGHKRCRTCKMVANLQNKILLLAQSKRLKEKVNVSIDTFWTCSKHTSKWQRMRGLHESTHVGESINVLVQIGDIICDVVQAGVGISQPLLKSFTDA